MNVLILGGSTFLGPHLVDALRARGHAVATFTRGERPLAALAGVERLHGDRTDDAALDALAERSWDAVIDTSGYEPEIVARSAARLAAARWVFVSSVSVYDTSEPAHESAPTLALDGVPPDDPAAAYGAKKAACERAVENAAGDDRTIVLRPGLIVGPFDPTNRFTYWVTRFDDGGDVLVPGPPERRIQLIDARDLAAFAVHLLERGASGVYNAVSPAGAFTAGDLVRACAADAAHPSSVVWADEAFLTGAGLEGWMDLPLWIPRSLEAFAAMMDADGERARAAGLTIRPLRETVADTRAWARTLGPEVARPAGITRERERELLDAWRVAG